MKKKRFYSAYAAAAALLMGTILTGCSSGETIEGAESTAVDLGLSVKWAAGNIGTKNPEDYGLYFAWGETTGYTAEQVTLGVRSFDDESYTDPSVFDNLTLEQDAAYVHMGGEWRMPTKRQFMELIDNTIQTWTDDYNGTGVAGCIFTSKINGNSVLLPAAGGCYNSSLRSVGLFGNYLSASWDSYYYAWILGFDLGIQNLLSGVRCCGYSVRGVCQ